MSFKLRRIGNSYGTTFSQEVLNAAGLKKEQDLELRVSPGEIRIVPAVASGVTVMLTADEAQAIAASELDSEAGRAALDKIKKGIAG